MINQETEIQVEGGEVAKFGGRYKFKDENGNPQYLPIYYVEEDKAYRCNNKDTVVLTPTASWTHELGDSPWQKKHKQGIRKIVLAKIAWDEIKVADEIEVFDPENHTLVSNVNGQITEQVQRVEQEKPKDIDKKLENISEKVAQKMTEDKKNTTLDMIKEAGIDAAKMTGANQANELITGALKKALKSMGLTHEFIESEAGHRLMKILGPLAIHYAADTQSEFIDGLVGKNASENIKEGCKFATQAAMGEIMEPMLQFIAPLLKDLASMGASGIAQAAKTGFSTPAGAVEEKVEENDAVSTLLKEKQKVSA